MKILILGMLLISSLASAATLYPRHAKLIEKAISAKCGYMYDLRLVSSQEEVLMNDNGNRVIGFVHSFKGVQPLDQNMVDRFNITVSSQYADGYDHSAQDWGLYSVESVNCELE